MSALVQPRLAERADSEHAIGALCGLAAIAAGIAAAIGSSGWLMTVCILVLLLAAAWLLPIRWSVCLLGALVPVQLYLTIPDSSATLRGAFVVSVALGVRVAVTRPALLRRGWVILAALFASVGVFDAFVATDRYGAWRGLYEWLPIFASLLVGTAVAADQLITRRLYAVLILGGVVEAALGLAQYAVGLDTVIGWLRLPISRLVYQANLLQERLVNLSFNWVMFDRVAAFGTFINGIDYAVYIAALFALAFALVLRTQGMRPRNILLALGACVLLVTALLLTFKGSGWIALGGAVLTVVLLSTKDLSRRTLAAGALIVLVVLVLALPLSDLLVQRITFLVQRELGATDTFGRLEIWTQLAQAFTVRPWFGYGLNNAIALIEPTRTLNGGAFGLVLTAPESGFVGSLVETGIFGFVALMGLFAGALLRAYRRWLVAPDARAIGIVAALVALLLGNLTVSGFTTDQSGLLLGLLLGLLWGEHPGRLRDQA